MQVPLTSVNQKLNYINLQAVSFLTKIKLTMMLFIVELFKYLLSSGDESYYSSPASGSNE